MTTTQRQAQPFPYRRHPREIAAAVTLRAAAAALVRPPADDRLAAGAAVAVTTACGALATRLALIAYLADPDPAPASAIRPFNPFTDPTPPALHGVGRRPDSTRLRLAGDRCVESWRRWCADPGAADEPLGVAGALALGAWCSWALGSDARAITRAQYAVDLVPDDALAGAVLRTARAGRRPAWG